MNLLHNFLPSIILTLTYYHFTEPKKCLPNSSNLERLFQKNDDQINQRRRQRRQSCPNKGTPKKKSNSSGKLLDSADLIGDDLDDLPSSFLEESLLLLSSSSSRRSLTSSSSESKLSRAKVSLVNRKRSQLDDYSRALSSADDSTVNSPQKLEKPSFPSTSSPLMSPVRHCSAGTSEEVDHSCEMISTSGSSLVPEQVTPPLTPERPPPSSTTSSFSSCRSADNNSGGQLRLSSLEGLLLPECNSISGGISSGNHRAGSPLSPYSYSLFSPLASSPLVGSRRGSSSGGSAQQISAQQRTRDGGTPTRSSSFLAFGRRRQSSSASSISSSSSSSSSLSSYSSPTTTATTSAVRLPLKTPRPNGNNSSETTPTPTSQTNGHG